MSDNPFDTIRRIHFGYAYPAAKCERCKRRRKLKGRRQGERYCHPCEVVGAIGFANTVIYSDGFSEYVRRHYDPNP